ncbi:GAF domain-containing protein [bacterium]|nr:MAG: GAF domain-containing protein [bacterium]
MPLTQSAGLTLDASRTAKLVEVGIALSAETNLEKLLEKIISYARELTLADAGTLYTVNGGFLDFKIIQNDTLGIRLGGPGSEPITLAPVPITRSAVSGYAALTGTLVNIPDVYESSDFDFTGPRRYDEKTGYRSRSMLVVPMHDHEGTIIGVLQLLNCTDPAQKTVIPFPREVEPIASAFASQAAISLTNAKLIKEVRDLFESLIRVMATAVDAKSPYTGNHVQRVAKLNTLLAEEINACGEGVFAGVHFTEDQMSEIRISGWLHDVGKITTPTWVMDKSTKLQTVFDRIELVKSRFTAAVLEAEARALRAFGARVSGDGEKVEESPEMARAKEETEALMADYSFIESVNQPSEFMSDEMLAKLNDIYRRRSGVVSGGGPLLTAEETLNLSIRKGSLNEHEIALMRQHVVDTAKILAEVPFDKTGKLKNVPVYAAQHHEKLNGTGYPRGIAETDLPLQSRILAVADFYEALSAKDRPYKKPMPPEVIYRIMKSCGEHGELDPKIVELLFERGIHEKFEELYEREKGAGRRSTDGI